MVQAVVYGVRKGIYFFFYFYYYLCKSLFALRIRRLAFPFFIHVHSILRVKYYVLDFDNYLLDYFFSTT